MKTNTVKSKILDEQKYVISKKVDAFFTDIYNVYMFILRFFKEAFSPPFEFKEIINQCYLVGYKSLALISLTGFITGIVFTKQSRPSLSNFGATSWLPSLISIAIVKALAPLVTALIAAGKVGSNMGAELGSMKVTEQIDAMEVSATNPFKYLVVTRITAVTLMIPILVLYTGFVGMMGSYLNIHQTELTSFTAFFKSAFASITFLDIYASIFKAFCYGFTIGVAGCFQGYYAQNGTQGVGRAANSTVVLSMFLIFVEEMIIVQFVNAIR
ncbi:ABC transporter permease [Arcicella rosea]|uniref:Phospholipid/cholesterol/gamma-HCH transport system permease protein n=1 Tax=Arcicella rosea TaxID=502909 RepID=A0A841EY39_9BACT|nr:ABC transporter permease [Arcicella rosea]MBB6004391.1 phospholipid/cholesterol/gamma-HCH transport system permease protein [Arcicella rosea]